MQSCTLLRVKLVLELQVLSVKLQVLRLFHTSKYTADTSLG